MFIKLISEKKNRRIFLVFIISISFLTFGCEPEEEKLADYSYQQNAVKDFTFAETIYSCFFKMTLEINNSEDLVLLGHDSINGALVTKLSNSSYKMDFGTGDSICPDGRYRSGVCNIIIEGNLMDSLSSAFLDFDDFYTEGFGVVGHCDIFNFGTTNGNIYLFFKLTDGYLNYQYEHEYGISYNFDKDILWVNGYETPLNFSDDSFLVSGHCYGRTAEHDRFLVTTRSNMEWPANCSYYSKGVVDFVLPDFSVGKGYLDFAGHYGSNPGCNREYWYAFRARVTNTNLFIGDSASFNIEY